MRRIWDAPGGVHPPDNKAQSLTSSIGQLPLPEKLILPLTQHVGAAAKVCVSVGEKVLKGQKLASASASISAAIHAPSSGWITAIEERAVAHPSGMSAPCIEITCDGEDRWIECMGYPDYKQATPPQLRNLIADAGVAGLGGAGFPSAAKLERGTHMPVDTLIINATECEPYITADDILIRERADQIIQGIDIISHLLGTPKTILIGIENNKPKAIAALNHHCQGSGIEVVSFPTKYPSGGEKQLIYILTGKEIPSGHLPADLGIVCLNSSTVFAIKRAVIDGEPLISRITTLAGEACDINRNYEILIGTPVSHLLAQNAFHPELCSRLIMGGPMMGFSLTSSDVPLVKSSTCILAPSHTEIPDDDPVQACIRCGLCAEACPASLLPQQLYWYARADDHERLQAHNLFDCIECGACSYVCPSNIPLVQHYRSSKADIVNARTAKATAAVARERFEFRQVRLEMADTVREAKREARRIVTEKAKITSPTTTQPSGSSAADIIKAAQLRGTARQASPEQQRAKLERTLMAAEMRLKEAQQRILQATNNASVDQQAQQLASVEAAKRKVEQATQRLTEVSH
jgi:electron transport complex protein RnfC